MTSQQVFASMEKFEGKMSDLYRWYSELYAEDTEAAALFYRMSVEEKSHLNTVRYERRLMLQNPKLFSSVQFDSLSMDEEVARVDQLLGARRRLPLEEAVRVAIDLEGGAAERCYKVALQNSGPELAKLLNGMAAGDRQHRDALAQFAERRGLVPAAALK